MAEMHTTEGTWVTWWESCQDQPVPENWADIVPSATTLNDLVAAVHSEKADTVLVGLLGQMQSGSGLAGMVGTWALFGRMKASACRDRKHCLDDYLSYLWLVMASYPLERRPRHVAANLTWDTAKAVRAPVAECPYEQSTLEYLLEACQAPHDEAPTGDQVIVRGHRLGIIDDTSARILHSVYMDGMPGRVAAVRHTTTETTIRWRCSSSLRRLAKHADALLAG